MTALLEAGCARAVQPSGLSDGATPATDATPDVVADRPVVSMPLSVRVMTGPRLPLAAGGGFRVRAERAGQAPVETVADDQGVARLALDTAPGGWDITAAKPGYYAVSVLGVTGALDGFLYSPELHPPSDGGEAFHVRGQLTGRVDASNDVAVQADPDYPDEATGSENYAALFGCPPGATSVQLVAIERNEAAPWGSKLLNGTLRQVSDACPDHDVSFDVALPSPPHPSVHSQWTLRFATDGWLQASERQGQDPVTSGVYRRASYSRSRGYTVGLEGPASDSPPGALRWDFESFEGELLPDISQIALGFGPLSRAGLFVGIEDVARDGEIDLGVVRDLRASGSDLESARLTVDAPDFECAAFDVSAVGTGSASAAWVGYSYPGTSVRDRALPHLPSGLSLAEQGITSGASLRLAAIHFHHGGQQCWAETHWFSSELAQTAETVVIGRGPSLAASGR